MSKHRRLVLSLAFLLVASLATGAQAASISMTIDVTGGSIPVDVFATAGQNTYVVDQPGLDSINAALAGLGSEYRFIALGGSSNNPGTASQGNLVLTGEIHSVVGGGGDSFLRITETEDGYTSPTGPTGTLNSSSTGNFTNQPAGGGHTASSAYNATSTPTYAVLSATTDVNGQAGGASVGLAPVSTLYTMTNVATFSLSAAGAIDIVDSLGVTGTVTASAVPEPSSLIMMSMGMPLAVVIASLIRRRRAAAQA